ncbi:MAG: DUF6328 family protein [Actinomycetota bacterium]
MADRRDRPPANPKETRKERVDRELGELLQELRVALPGVQVLFAFLLTVAFSQGFDRMTDLQRNVYFASFMCTAVSSVLLIAPTAYHRIRWRAYDKERMLFSANRMSIAGMVFLALGITGAVHLIADVVFNVAAAAFTAGAIAGSLAWFWFGLPILRGRTDSQKD